jgi:hypothetical protein
LIINVNGSPKNEIVAPVCQRCGVILRCDHSPSFFNTQLLFLPIKSSIAEIGVVSDAATVMPLPSILSPTPRRPRRRTSK